MMEKWEELEMLGNELLAEAAEMKAKAKPKSVFPEYPAADQTRNRVKIQREAGSISRLSMDDLFSIRIVEGKKDRRTRTRADKMVVKFAGQHDLVYWLNQNLKAVTDDC